MSGDADTVDEDFGSAFAAAVVSMGAQATESAAALDASPEVVEDSYVAAPLDQTPVDPPQKVDAAPAQTVQEAPTAPEDVWAGLSPSQRAAVERLSKSVEGLQDQNRRRITEIERLKSGATKADVRRAASVEIERFNADFPEVAAPVKEMIAAAQAETEYLRQSVEALNQNALERAIVQQQDILTSRHPDWHQIAGTDDFQGWLLEQPRGVQDIAVRNKDNIMDAKDAAVLFTLYKRDVEPAADPAATAPRPQLTPKRQRQLESSVTAPNRGPAPAPTTADDFSAAFRSRAREYQRTQS